MKKVVKTEEETKRDLLVIEVRNAKLSVERCVRLVKRRQVMLTWFPENSDLYKETRCLLAEDKWCLIAATKSYEEKHKTLADHCHKHNLAGDTFLDVFELLELLAEKN